MMRLTDKKKDDKTEPEQPDIFKELFGVETKRIDEIMDIHFTLAQGALKETPKLKLYQIIINVSNDKDITELERVIVGYHLGRDAVKATDTIEKKRHQKKRSQSPTMKFVGLNREVVS